MWTASLRCWGLLLVLVGCPASGEGMRAGVSPPEVRSTPWTAMVRPVGRHRWVDDATLRYGWSGAGFTVRFFGSSLHARLDDAARYHAVIVDGEDERILETSPGERRVTIVDGLPVVEHEVTVVRRTEGHLGPTTVFSVEADGPLRPVPEPTARVEVIGDSITTGYGNIGRSRSCPYSPRTQDLRRTYASLAARAVGAELLVVAWSGKGVVHNYGDDRIEPMPALYERSVPTEPDSRWSFTEPVDVVVVNLGTNDVSTEGDPSEEEFVAGYVELLTRVRGYHSDAVILTTVAPLLGDDERMTVEAYIDRALAQRRLGGDAEVRRIELHVEADGWGCDWHPSAATHEAMARKLEPELRRALR